jgi:LysM repeat protein
MRLRDSKLVGFIMGFGAVTLIGGLLLGDWLFSKRSPAPTLVPSAIPLSARSTEPSTRQEERVTSAGASAALAQVVLTPTSTPQPPPTSTPSPAEPVEHIVRPGDTLFDIALAYGVSVEAIQQANDLQGDQIQPNQTLLIPLDSLSTPTPFPSIDVASAQPELTAAPLENAWTPSVLEGNLEEAYPETLPGNRFTVHYQPDTPAARAPNQLYASVDAVLNHIEDRLQVTMEEPFDVYFAGSLFAGEDAALRGRSFSSERRNFFLYDDTGTPEERRYVIIHELTHLVAWNTIGKPSSVMLHEGLAVYTGREALESGGFIPLSDFCAAYYQAGQLPHLGGTRPYLGHIRDLDLYFSSGCFVEYLIRTRGLNKFEQVFTTGDYPGIYGRTLSQLEAAWIATLKPVARNLDFEAEDLVTSVSKLAEAYDRLLQDFAGFPSQLAAYHELDQARIAVLQARFDEAREHMAEFETLLAGE